jgi:hypothetical protein
MIKRNHDMDDLFDLSGTAAVRTESGRLLFGVGERTSHGVLVCARA